jgi:protein TonB
MFDLVTGKARHIPQHATLPIVLSTTAQALALTAVIAIPMLFVTEQMPEIPTMMAFVAAPPPPATPPPPPAPAAAKPTPAQSRPVPVTSELAAPVTAPLTIEAEPPGTDEAFDEGVPGGVEGGVPGGVVGGVVGGLPEPAPPPPPPPSKRGPVRIGGQIGAPALLYRVEPSYPSFAVKAHLEGIVILVAVVDREGKVEDVEVLRSAGPLLDREALLAVRQWRYSPLVLNGIRESFTLTVTLSFHLEMGS